MTRQPALGQRTIAVIGTILCFLIVLLLSGFQDCVDRGPVTNCNFVPPEPGMYSIIRRNLDGNFVHETVEFIPSEIHPEFGTLVTDCNKILSYHKLN